MNVLFIKKLNLHHRTKESLDLSPPVEMEIGEGVRATVQPGERHLEIVTKRHVDRALLKVAENRGVSKTQPDGSKEYLKEIRISGDSHPETVVVHDFVSCLAFLLNVPLSLSSPPDSAHFEAEDEDDEKLLKTFGTSEFFGETSARVSSRTFGGGFGTTEVEALLPRRVGLRIYANALESTYAGARFREFWRVLESAFGDKGASLVKRLRDYQPAKDLGFTHSELKKLLDLRNDASHADSRLGLHKVVEVQHRCEAALPRLNNLAERVILTKKSWGTQGLGVNEVIKLSGYVGPESEIVIFRSASPPSDE